LGTGTFTIASPNSNTDRTLTLPNASGTLNVSGAPNEVPAGSAAAPAIYPTGDTNTGIFFPAADTIAFAEGGVESARLDSSGNLGLGVTPSPWMTSAVALQVGAYSSVFTAPGGDSNLTSNSYLSAGGNYRSIAGIGGSRYQLDFGVHRWLTAAAVSSGSVQTYVASMTLDASGNLMVGTISPSFSAGSRGNITVGGSGSAIFALQTGGTAKGYVFHDGTEMSIANEANGFLRFYTNATERARIHAGGSFSVLSTSISGSFSDTTPRFFITPTSASSSYLWHTSASADFNFYMNRTNTGTAGYILFGAGATVTGSITTNGTSTSYITSSDYRLKNSVAPMTGALAKVAQLKPCTYKWKSDGSDGEGFIAHELQEVCPDAVTGEKDAVNADGSIKPQGIDTSFLVATLTAAIQELKADLDATKAELAALKGQA
jgi:hypothetical protein